ncbi:MAG: ankyrin repeat domain-containing protein, partial [Verrucomicrobiota bacterium]|nr:ankyrin repeat domain-containing protein [Verrucomicrobiota bacterium]
ASWRNDIETVKAHIVDGTNIDTVDDWTGKTALHYAAEYGHLEIAKLLLANGANVNRRDDDKATPLYFAAVGGFVDVARLLLDYGADINARDKAKESPMDGAVFFGHMNVADLFQSFMGIVEYDMADRFRLEATALTSGWYGFLRKKKRVDSRLFQVQASFDLVNWRTAKVFDTGKAPFIFRGSKTITYGRRFFRLRPYTIPLEPPFNRIDPNYELFEAQQIDGNLDGQAHELFESEYVFNPGFEVVSEGQRGQSTYLSGQLTYAQFAEFNDGDWEGISDHTVSIGLGWNPEGIHLIVVVEDDMHHHTKEEADQGDAVRVLFTDANREEVMSEYLFALAEPYMGDDFLYEKGMLGDTIKGSRVGYAEQISGRGSFDVVMFRTQKTIYPHTGTTIYEMSFSPEAIGLESLQKNVKFGLGVAVIDSDPDAPGLQGWSGWGPESVVLETNPAETALITLGGSRGGDGGE